MDNLARDENLDREIGPFIQRLARMPALEDIHRAGHEFIYRFPPQRALEVASYASFANPFFLPDIPREQAAGIAVDTGQFAEMIMRAKLTASHAKQLNVLVACAPKSASTFIQGALSQALQLPSAGLFTATIDAGSGSFLGANLMEQEPDELALIRAGLNMRGYVSQHHSRCSPYLCGLLGTYNVRPIVTHRNILDTLVSMDDMVIQWRSAGGHADQKYFNDAMPAGFENLERTDRLTILAQRWTPWLVQFYITWKKCEARGLVKPLFISYEDDFLGDKQVLARRVAEYLGLGDEKAAALANAFGDTSDGGARRLNKGVAGRGKDMPDAVRALVGEIASYYRDDVDLSPLVDA